KGFIGPTWMKTLVPGGCCKGFRRARPNRSRRNAAGLDPGGKVEHFPPARGTTSRRAKTVARGEHGHDAPERLSPPPHAEDGCGNAEGPEPALGQRGGGCLPSSTSRQTAGMPR